MSSGADAAATYEGGLIGGTAWLFARPEMEGRLDYLFVDEAGQVSIAKRKQRQGHGIGEHVLQDGGARQEFPHKFLIILAIFL